MKKIIFIVSSMILGAIILLAAAGVFFLRTETGSLKLISWGLGRYTGSHNVEAPVLKGNLWHGVTLYKVELRDIPGFPQGTVIQIQELRAELAYPALEGLAVDINNGRLRLPGSDPIIFYGSFRNGLFDLTVSSRNVDVKGMLDVFAEGNRLGPLSGLITDFEAKVSGPLFQPGLKGSFFVRDFVREKFVLAESSAFFDLIVRDMRKDLKLMGELRLEGGTVSGPRTALVRLEEAAAFFSGNVSLPSFQIKGSARVENTDINISLSGTFIEPRLVLNSNPPLSQERLLLMLGTGRSWTRTEKGLEKKELSPEVSREFVDFFIFAGTGRTMAQRLGVDELTFILEQDSKGVAVKKSLTGKLDASYGVEQSQGPEGEPGTVTQKVGTEYKVTDKISVGLEKEITQESEAGPETEKETEDTIYLKYKKSF